MTDTVGPTHDFPLFTNGQNDRTYVTKAGCASSWSIISITSKEEAAANLVDRLKQFCPSLGSIQISKTDPWNSIEKFVLDGATKIVACAGGYPNSLMVPLWLGKILMISSPSDGPFPMIGSVIVGTGPAHDKFASHYSIGIFQHDFDDRSAILARVDDSAPVHYTSPFLKVGDGVMWSDWYQRATVASALEDFFMRIE